MFLPLPVSLGILCCFPHLPMLDLFTQWASARAHSAAAPHACFSSRRGVQTPFPLFSFGFWACMYIAVFNSLFALVDKYETSGTINTNMNHTLKIMAIKRHRTTLNVIKSQCRREDWKRQITWLWWALRLGTMCSIAGAPRICLQNSVPQRKLD